MAKIQTDRQLLGCLGLTEAQAADFLDRSRQAVNAVLGNGSTRKKYLKPADILILRLAAKAEGRDVPDNLVLDYVRECFGQKQAEKVRTAFGALAGPLKLENVSEVWVIIPDFARLRQAGPAHAETIGRLPVDFPSTRFVYLSGTPIQEAALREFVNGHIGHSNSKASQLDFISENVVGAQQTMLITEPRGHDPKVYVLVRSGFMHTPHASGASISSYLIHELPKLHALPPLEADAQGAQKGVRAG